MIILDLTGLKEKPPDIWPKNMPKKIRLIKGRHQNDYDIHLMERCTPWYKELCQNLGKKYPNHSSVLPVGVDYYDLPDGAKIIEV